MNITPTNLFPVPVEKRLQRIARDAYEKSPYGHGYHDGQSAEVAVAEEIMKLGSHSADDAYEIAQEIAARVIEVCDEEAYSEFKSSR